uniref:SsDNA binding protein n=1 Tax=uncultured marine virus TaxID=186617 RepID=A0A0F7LBF2_9VIRU|nr:ssDNA binding protein [uncultured marine virus]
MQRQAGLSPGKRIQKPDYQYHAPSSSLRTQWKELMESNPASDLLATLSETERGFLSTYLNSEPLEVVMERGSWLLARYHLEKSTPSLMRFLDAVACIRTEQ